MPKASLMSVMWPRRSARPKAATTTSPSSLRRSPRFQGMRADEAVKWAPLRLHRIYRTAEYALVEVVSDH
jgi:hypothetical protein